MGDTTAHLMICTCEKTMQLDARAIGRACSGRITQANQLGLLSSLNRRDLSPVCQALWFFRRCRSSDELWCHPSFPPAAWSPAWSDTHALMKP